MCLSGPQATLPPTHAAHCCQHCCAGTSIFCGHTAHSAGNIMTRSGRNRPHLTLLLRRHRKYFSVALSMPEPRLCHTPQAQAAPGGAATQPTEAHQRVRKQCVQAPLSLLCHVPVAVAACANPAAACTRAVLCSVAAPKVLQNDTHT